MKPLDVRLASRKKKKKSSWDLTLLPNSVVVTKKTSTGTADEFRFAALVFNVLCN